MSSVDILHPVKALGHVPQEEEEEEEEPASVELETSLELGLLERARHAVSRWMHNSPHLYCTSSALSCHPLLFTAM